MHGPLSDVLVQMPPVVCSNASTHQMHFDTRGFNWLTVDVMFGSSHTSHAKPTVLKIGELDTTVVSSFADIVKFTGGTAESTSAGFVIPEVDQNTGTGGVVEFQISLLGRKRFLMLNLTTGADTYPQNHAVLARLSQAQQHEYGAGERQVLNRNLTNMTQTMLMTVGPNAASDT